MKKFLYIGFRALALCVAAFLVVSSAADIAGWVPYSMNPPPSLERRVLGSLPGLLFAALLMLPYRKLGVGWLRKTALGALALLTLAAVFLSLQAILEGIRGTKDWRIIPTMGVLAAILVGNFIAVFWKLKEPNKLITDNSGELTLPSVSD